MFKCYPVRTGKPGFVQMKPNSGQFKPGQSGNPSGMPKGFSYKQRIMRDFVLPEKEHIAKLVIEMAKDGDKDMLKFLAERLFPRPQDNVVEFRFDKEVTEKSLFESGSDVIDQTAKGEMFAVDASLITAMLKSHREGLTLQNMSAELKELRELVNKLGNK